MAVVALGNCRDVISVFTAREYAVVTAGTGTERLQVIERDADPGVRLVTVFAHVGGRQVVGRLAGRRCAVVTADAIGRNSGVIKAYDRRKCDRQMTALALVTSWWVIDRFTNGGIIIVTTVALAVSFIMVHAFQWNKTTRGMTGIATLCCRDMASWLRGRGYDSTLRVAILAFPQRAGEVAATMAIAAVAGNMRAIEAEARGIVIKIGADRRLS